MNSLFDAIPYLDSYRLSFVVLACLSVAILLQNLLTAPLSFGKNEQIPGMPLQFDHSKLSFRAMRAFQNFAENLPAFTAALLAAIAIGAAPTLINTAAMIYLAARLIYWAIYYAGVGKVAGGPRTVVFVVGFLANIVIAIAALVAMI